MNNILKFAILAGDMRQLRLAELLRQDGHDVKVFAMEKAQSSEHINTASDLEDALSGADCAVLPLPIDTEGGYLNTPMSNAKYTIDEVLSKLPHTCIAAGGRLNCEHYTKAGKLGIKLFDYFDREEVAVLNAIPTAEGVLQIAMEELPVTLHGTKCLVIGYGRIGKVLTRYLQALGAGVTVCARKIEDFAWINAYGCKSVHIDDLEHILSEFELIINTAPSRVLTEKLLGRLKKNCLCIDVASKPGGLDFNAASRLGIRAIWALSLPGKVAPITSGKIIRDTIYNILNEQEA